MEGGGQFLGKFTYKVLASYEVLKSLCLDVWWLFKPILVISPRPRPKSRLIKKSFKVSK